MLHGWRASGGQTAGDGVRGQRCGCGCGCGCGYEIAIGLTCVYPEHDEARDPRDQRAPQLPVNVEPGLPWWSLKNQAGYPKEQHNTSIIINYNYSYKRRPERAQRENKRRWQAQEGGLGSVGGAGQQPRWLGVAESCPTNSRKSISRNRNRNRNKMIYRTRCTAHPPASR